MGRMLNVREVAEKLGCCKASVFNWSRDGIIPQQRKLGRATRWGEEELNQCMSRLPVGSYGEGGEIKP